MLRRGDHFDEDFVRARRKVVSALLGESTVTAELASRLGFIAIHGLGPDYYRTLLQQVASVSPAQIHALIQNELDPSREAVIVLGDRDHPGPRVCQRRAHRRPDHRARGPLTSSHRNTYNHAAGWRCRLTLQVQRRSITTARSQSGTTLTYETTRPARSHEATTGLQRSSGDSARLPGVLPDGRISVNVSNYNVIDHLRG